MGNHRIQDDNPEWTKEDFKRARPAAEMLPEILGKEKTEELMKRGHGQRGSQKKPKKTPISIRLSPEVVDYFRSTGNGWQGRMDEVLREYVSSHQ